MRLGESDQSVLVRVTSESGQVASGGASSVARLGQHGLSKRSSSKQNVTLFLDPFCVDSGLVILMVLFLSVLTLRQVLGRERAPGCDGSGTSLWAAVPLLSVRVCVHAVHIHVGMGTSAGCHELPFPW